MSDSLIRLRQINQPDISGYISQVVPQVLKASGLTLSGLALVPTGSGIYDLGTPERPFDDVYANKLRIPSGSGLYFGSVPFTAYYSGNNAVLSFGSYAITTSPVGLTIIGPSGSQGFSGVSGASGASGTSVTGVFSSGNYMNIYLNNGRINNVLMPSGGSGASGVSLTGFHQSGSWLWPQFSNRTSGAPVYVSGEQGPQGIAGGILIDCSLLTGWGQNQVKPEVTIYNVDPLGSQNPTLNFIKGMRYTVGVSGLNTFTPGPGTGTNFYTGEQGGTGYFRFCFWDISLNPNDCGKTGRLVSFECPSVGDTVILDDYLKSEGYANDAWSNIDEDPLKRSVSFNIKWSAQTGYRYGFVRCELDGATNQGNPGMGGVVLGQAALNYFGPAGPTGAPGPQGIPGPQGQRGPAGQSSPGIGISYVEQGNYQI